jgi:hypothetical protein
MFTWPYKIGKICVRITRLLCLHLVQALYLPPWITMMMMPYYLSIHLSLYILFISLPSFKTILVLAMNPLSLIVAPAIAI